MTGALAPGLGSRQVTGESKGVAYLVINEVDAVLAQVAPIDLRTIRPPSGVDDRPPVLVTGKAAPGQERRAPAIRCLGASKGDPEASRSGAARH